MNFAVSASKRRMERPLPALLGRYGPEHPERTYLPSGENAAALTPFKCPRNWRSSLPVSVSQSFNVLSPLPATKRLPSGATAIQSTPVAAIVGWTALGAIPGAIIGTTRIIPPPAPPAAGFGGAFCAGNERISLAFSTVHRRTTPSMPPESARLPSGRYSTVLTLGDGWP